MKRFALIVAGAMLVGCSQETKPTPTQTTDATPMQPTAAAAPSAPVQPTVPAIPAQPAAPTVAAPTPAAPAEPTAPTVAPVPAPAPAPAPAPTATAAKPNPIFELTQDNKIYVFGSVQAMADYNGGKLQPTVVEKPNFTPGGRTLVIQATDAAQADEILASYNKLHPVVK